MKKILFTLFFPVLLNAQVGIGTANPQADLHVSGNTSTIRISSLDAINNPTHNNGVNPSGAFVTASGDITLNPSGNDTGPNGTISPLNFLTSNQNFIPDGLNGYGVILNNDTNTTRSVGTICTMPLTVPAEGIVEIKYTISSLLSKTDLNSSLTPFNDISERAVIIYYCIDVNSDGLDATETSKKFGISSQSYSSYDQGILGYSFSNGFGYSSLPAGNHTLYFYAETIDGVSKFTSVGFGGVTDLLRIRMYN